MARFSLSLTILVVCLQLDCSLVAGDCPSIVSRSEWGARAPRSISYLSRQRVRYAIVHHSATRRCSSTSDCARAVRGIQNFHMNRRGGRGWSDIGYNFIIGGDGTVFEGRGWDRIGAHTFGYNSVGLGFCLIGDFRNSHPPSDQMRAARDLIECGRTLNKLPSDYTLKGHKDLGNTACPGNQLYRSVRSWPHY